MIPSPLKSVRKYCITDCCCDNVEEVKECIIKSCPLYPFRNNKKEIKGSVIKKIRLNCIECSDKMMLVSSCPFKDCNLWPYRMGKAPNRTGRKVPQKTIDSLKRYQDTRKKLNTPKSTRTPCRQNPKRTSAKDVAKWVDKNKKSLKIIFNGLEKGKEK